MEQWQVLLVVVVVASIFIFVLWMVKHEQLLEPGNFKGSRKIKVGEVETFLGC